MARVAFSGDLTGWIGSQEAKKPRSYWPPVSYSITGFLLAPQAET